MDVADLRHEDLAGRIGEAFSLEADGTELTLELVAATKPPEKRPDNLHQAEFRGPADRLLPQQIYELRHSELGTLELFLVPVGERDDGFVYEAVFTRLDD